MLVYIDPFTRHIEHKPYMKKLNHLERVPWTSHHLKDIKKGTFIREMSKLVTLNSTFDGYSKSIYELKCLYICWGYPHNLLDHWIKENYQKHWNNRLSIQNAETANVFVLKAEFNPAWTLFNVCEMQNVIYESWCSHLFIKYEQMIELCCSIDSPVDL